MSRHQSISRGATLFWAGDDSVICGNVLSGVLKVTASLADGREQIVGLLYAPDFVGQPQPGDVAFTVTALTDTQLCVFPRAPFQTMLEDHVAMERLLLRRTMSALDEARSRMLMLSRGTAEERIAGFLLEMADRAAEADFSFDPGASMTMDLPLSRGQIADVLGLTIETVSRHMTQLRAAGVIALPGGRLVTLLDRPALRHRALVAQH